MTQRFEAARARRSRAVLHDDTPLRRDLLHVPVGEPRPGVRVLSPAGEVDLCTAPLLRDAAFAAVAAGPRHLVVDLCGVTFCGSTGLVVLMDARRHAQAHGVGFRTAGATRCVRRVLEITGLGPVLAHGDTLDVVLGELALADRPAGSTGRSS
ncbi:STAS domain-containing protein [Pseudonocardia nigra]|uniref:STAS domain-containing protein n=1 Tax=Pseudonocardia nigra TaxID=1921578 RepID=UPI001C601340|nr:STAS domain-containing protein [Pseudonocardia nigra]